MAKDTQTTDLVIKGLKNELLIVDPMKVDHLIEDVEDKNRTHLLLSNGASLKVPFPIVQIDHLIRMAKGLGTRPGVKVDVKQQAQGTGSNRASRRASKARKLK